jgi:aminopeptidase-like protein
MLDSGEDIYALARLLFPICRSITGEGVRRTLRLIQERLPALRIREIPAGTQCFDWKIPREWNIRDAYVLDPEGKKIVDFQASNLHVVGYSTPVDAEMELDELEQHLYSLPDQPTAIPYVTSYYQERWGFCIPHVLRQSLRAGRYRVKIDSDFSSGSMTFGEYVLPGETDREVLLSTYICHPSMANNEVSGPCVTTFLGEWLASLPRRRYTYRIVFVPETIGSICYLSLNHQAMKQRVAAGFNVTCVGDDRTYSYLPSRAENTLADRTALHVLHHVYPGFQRFSYRDRGSDERQYCSPGIDLPVVSVMRSKYGCYPEYHTSLDDLSLISPAGLFGAYGALVRCLQCLEADFVPRATVCCEPQLGKRGLYPTLSAKGSAAGVRAMMDLLAYADGRLSLLAIADKIEVPMWDLIPIAERLCTEGLLERVS